MRSWSADTWWTTAGIVLAVASMAIGFPLLRWFGGLSEEPPVPAIRMPATYPSAQLQVRRAMATP